MKIGFVSMPLTGHLHPMTALGRRMQARGHDVTFFGLPDAEQIVRNAGLKFVAFGEERYPVGTTPAMYAHVAALKGEDVIRYSFQEMHPTRTRITLEQLPEKLVKAGTEAVVIDTVHFFAELAPMSLGIPYAHISNILHLDRSGATPPCTVGWAYEDSPAARARNLAAIERIDTAFAPVRELARSWAVRQGLRIDWNAPSPTLSKLAVITQTPQEFDLPGMPHDAAFHYAGPFYEDGGREKVEFPWEKLTGKPLIYASMGTLVNGLADVFRLILKTAGAIPGRQLVLSIGGNLRVEDLGPIPPGAIVVAKAPQLELLKRAELCITHAGINTTLESLALGVPMVAIPVGFDQPGVAERVAYHGVGRTVPVGSLDEKGLAAAIHEVLNDPTCRESAQRFQKVIAETRGLDRAAEVLEKAFVSAAGRRDIPTP